MSTDPAPWSKLEEIKQQSQFLRGQIAQELAQPTDHFEETTAHLLKHHGIYQQDDRDRRGQPGPEGQERTWIMMVRVKIPGGRLTADQWLLLSALADRFGNGTIRITNRQDVQFHGVRKVLLAPLMQALHQAGLTTLGACGDVVRNVLVCPAPVADGGIREQLFAHTQQLTAHFLPRTKAYQEIWQGAGSDSVCSTGQFPPASEEEEPLYGTNYLPRKFKIAFGLPEDNCVDIYTNDLGFLALAEHGQIRGYEVLVGGGLGMTPTDKTTFVALAQPLAFIRPEEAIPLAEAVVKLFRDHGNRANRRRARLKYLVADWGLQRFRRELERYYGQPLLPPQNLSLIGLDHHLGWHLQPNGRWFYGLYVENGRVADRQARLKTALEQICQQFRPGIRLTPMMSVLITDLAAEDRSKLERVLREHGVRLSEEVPLVRQYSGACVALPTCGLAITESERALPGILDGLEDVLARLGLARLPICIRMTGCPNGCGRPYNAEIGLVGRAKDQYALYLGGSFLGNRLGFLYEPMVPRSQIVPLLTSLFEVFSHHRLSGETFGDFCVRTGPESLRHLVISRDKTN
ncbi:MAG: NADPH-dependent assimilatory sulfite reductase hemoprotein subunit [Thermoguttaceae bacterium]|nr:NADPH-dependent assimilatory sulfite reductase hemoprotein subunit [Thermoguttaceae bacterium]MDW8038453.1 NADPH-dependent assimilatory sulfite reductase hemoprotein subunit [Thermoguttaceae bacterium]